MAVEKKRDEITVRVRSSARGVAMARAMATVAGMLMQASPGHAGQGVSTPQLEEYVRRVREDETFNGGKTVAVDPGLQVVEMPGWEFRQVLHVYRKPAEHAGLRMEGNHHTATRSEVLRRKLGSDAAWNLFMTYDFCNHGTCPEAENIQEYLVCDDTPATSEHFAVGGECSGGWLVEHLCNDDSAYQMNLAYGRFTRGELGRDHCLGKRRFTAPTRCTVQW
jgi:hypothetical protein